VARRLPACSHMKRRQFNTMFGAAGLSLSQKSLAMERSVALVQPDVIQLSKNDWMPNNEQLPVLLYRNAVSIEGQDPAAFFGVIPTQRLAATMARWRL